MLYSVSFQTFPKFWSCKDVVIHSFQYLDFLSLNCCSLVCSSFLLMSFNPSCVYCLNLNDDMDKQVLEHVNNMNLRGWKRLSNLKHLHFNVSSLRLEFKEKIETKDEDKDQLEDDIDGLLWLKSLDKIVKEEGITTKETQMCVSPSFVNGLLSIQTIEILNITLKSYGFGTADFILDLSESRMISNTNSIKQFTFIVGKPLDGYFVNNDRDYCRLTNCQLKLLNCEKCVLSNVHFQVALSNKCQYVQLKNKCFVNVLSVIQDDDTVFDTKTETEKVCRSRDVN